MIALTESTGVSLSALKSYVAQALQFLGVNSKLPVNSPLANTNLAIQNNFPVVRANHWVYRL